jgi:uncharacterized protein YdiU (UPF0061 family)
MASNSVDHTLFFRRLCNAAESSEKDASVAALFSDPAPFHDWAEQWRKRLALESDVTADVRAASMRLANPAFIPRNHRIEELIVAAVQQDDFAPFEALLQVVMRPYEEQPAFEHFAAPPLPEERVQATFCGT